MSAYTVGNLPRMTRESLAALIKTKHSGLAIIDVRDSDYIGGHIVGCQNIPTGQHDHRMPELVRTLKDKNTVVFHCALSQQRGPASALRYLRERDRMEAAAPASEVATDPNLRQKVYVLEGGFTKWQEKFGEDPELTEGYIKDLWQD